jgi:lanosterol synthase
MSSPLIATLTSNKLWQGLPEQPKPKTALEAAQNGFAFYRHLQANDGHWPGEYGGVMFLLPGLIIGSYVTGVGFTLEERLEFIRLLFNRANKEDGGWGM